MTETILEPLSMQQKLKLNLKEISERVKKQLKAEFPGCKFSVRTEYYSMGQSLHVSLMQSDRRVKLRFDELSERAIYTHMDNGSRTKEQIQALQDKPYHQLNQYCLIEEYDADKWVNGVFLTEAGFKMLARVLDIVNQFNWDHSDSSIDYFDVHFYLHLNLGKWDKPFIDGVKE